MIYKSFAYSPTHKIINSDFTPLKKISLVWLFVIVGESILFPLWLGQIGFAVSAVVTALIIILIIRWLHYPISARYLFGLFILTLIFMNTDAISTTPSLNYLGKFSWIFLGMLSVYIILNLLNILKTFIKHPILIAFAFFIFLQTLWSFLFSPDVVVAIIQRSIFFLAVFLVVVDFLLNSSNYAILGLFFMFHLAGMSIAIALILEYLYPYNLGISASILSGIERSGGLYLNAGAAAFVISFCSLIAAWLGHKKFVSHVFALLSLGILIIALLTTFSIQGVFSFVLIAIGTAIMFLSKRARGLFIPLMVIVFTLISLLLLSGYLLKDISLIEQLPLTSDNNWRAITSIEILSGDYGSVLTAMSRSNRTELIQDTWRAIQREPWLGYGTGYYGLASNPEFRPHNMFLLLWVENGIFMLLYFLVILVKIIITNVRIADDERWYRLLLIANLVVFMMARHVLFFYRYLAIILAVIFVIDQISLSGKKHTQIKHIAI